MLNTEKITINYIDKDYNTVEVTRIAPKNVLDLNYFQYAVQYHAYNLALTFLQSETIRVQYEDISKLDGETDKERLDIHEKNKDKVGKAHDHWSDIVTKFNKNLDAKDDDFSLMSVFEADVFAKTYTTLALDFDTVYTTKSGAKGSTKAVKSPSKLYDENKKFIKAPVLALEKLVDRMFTEIVPKAEKAEVFNPFVEILNKMYGIDTLNASVYKPANFKDIPVKYWTKYLESLRASKPKVAKSVICELVPEATLLKSCLAIGLTKLGVVEIENYDTPVERTLEMARQAVKKNSKKDKEETKKTK